MPGTAVAIGSNGPRYSTGASGFMSNVSRWLGPPQSQSTITARAGGESSRAPAHRASDVCQRKAHRAGRPGAKESPPRRVKADAGVRLTLSRVANAVGSPQVSGPIAGISIIPETGRPFTGRAR